jgi:DNA-binding MarR family transcriptional regulator
MTQDSSVRERSRPAADSGGRSGAGANGNGSAAGRDIDMRPLREYLGYVLRRAQMMAYADFFAALTELDLSPGQFGVLTVIDTNPGLRQSQVSRALGIQKTNFVAVLNEFERRGLAVRKAAARDRRSYALHLTPEGEALLRRARSAQARHEARMLSRLGAEGREQLLQLLSKLMGTA